MEKITELLAAKVVTEDGDYVCRVIDLRSEGAPEHGLRGEDRRITELLYGENGFLQVIGLQQLEVKTLPWKAVTNFSAGQVVVKMSDLE